MIERMLSQGKVNAGGSIGSAFKSDDSGCNNKLSIVNILSTQGDSSSNGTHFGDRKYSTTTKIKSNSISSGSNERTSMKKAKKGSSEPKIQVKPKEPVCKIDESKKPEFYQRMKNDHSRNLCHQQNNHHRYKMYSSSEREHEEVPANFSSKITEKLKIAKKQVKDILSKSRAKATNINPANIKSSGPLLKKSRGRSNKSGQLSNRNSSNEGVGIGTIKIKKNSQQTIKFNKKKIQFVRQHSQNNKRTRSLSNNPKMFGSKKSDESGNTNNDADDHSSGSKKVSTKVERHQNWKVNGNKNEKIGAIASISKYSTPGNFPADNFQACKLAKENRNCEADNHLVNKDGNPISPTSTKSLIENDNTHAESNSKDAEKSKSNILSMTMKKKEGKATKNSGTIDASSYNTLISHQSKSFSNIKNEKSGGSIIDRKAIAISSKEDSSGLIKTTKRYKAPQEVQRKEKHSEIHVNNEIAKGYNLGFNYKRSSIKSNDSEDILKSPMTQGSDKCYLDTFSKTDKQSEEKSKKEYSEKHNMHDSLKFEHNNYFVTEKYNLANEFRDKRYSTQPDTNFSEPKKSKRDRQLKSPNYDCNHIQEGMSLHSFSSRTIEEGSSSKQIFFDNKIHMSKETRKKIRMEIKPEFEGAAKNRKPVFKDYAKNEAVLTSKGQRKKQGRGSKISNSVSESSTMLNNSFQNRENLKERHKNRQISSASSFQRCKSGSKTSYERVNSKPKVVQEYKERSQGSHTSNNREVVHQEKQPREVMYTHTSKAIDETLSSIYSTIEENSVCNKRHDISVVEADGILDQINSRMMKLHFEMIYKNLDKEEGKCEDFSFEIDNTNNMLVPKNSNAPIKTKNFIQLPNREDLYVEQEGSDGNPQWVADTQTIRIFPTSPTRRQNASISSPFTSPETNPRSPNGTSVMSPNTGPKSSSSKVADPRVKTSMYKYQCSSSHYYENSLFVEKPTLKKDQIMVEINDHEDNTKDKNDDLEIERELEYSQNFIYLNDSSSQIERSFESKNSEGTDSINPNNYSFISGVSNFVKQGKEKRFMSFLREKIHVLEEKTICLYPSLSTQNQLKHYKPSHFAINYKQPKGPELEYFKF
ncbi:unnamed protein product [Moneuplotes crassus]|uniref:Uncharacterized protein n=2 Tax=Euplotes crassus TaxID=5936 RepID=A0AAD1XKA2_EUPCR|nr:unnamed protein product [Moneuplotes crassus]